MEDFTAAQREAIGQLARADAQAQYARLRAAGFSPERVMTMMEEMVDELALRSWCAHGPSVLHLGHEPSVDLVSEVPAEEERKPWWKLW